MVFNYALPIVDGSAGGYDFNNSQMESYYPQSAPRDIPRQTSRYTTVAPADLYTPAIASGQMSEPGYSYGSRQMTAYPTPPKDSYEDRARDGATR